MKLVLCTLVVNEPLTPNADSCVRVKTSHEPVFMTNALDRGSECEVEALRQDNIFLMYADDGSNLYLLQNPNFFTECTT